jgi:preprotein translocase subunit YajC
MRSAALLLLFVGVIMMVVVAPVAGKGKKEKTAVSGTLQGKVVSVNGANVVVKVAKKEVTVATDDKTVVTLDGNAAKVGDLKAGMHVVVTPAEGIATEIKATSPKVEK